MTLISEQGRHLLQHHKDLLGDKWEVTFEGRLYAIVFLFTTKHIIDERLFVIPPDQTPHQINVETGRIIAEAAEKWLEDHANIICAFPNKKVDLTDLTY